MEGLLPELNTHLPDDIRLNGVEVVSISFNLIQAVKQKTYRFYFSNYADFHPFASAFLVNVSEDLNLELMQEAAQIFIGEYDFKSFCKPSVNKTDYKREVISAGINTSDEFQGIFFPSKISYFEVIGTGFLHHQVRKMMTAIWEVGKGNWELKAIQERLTHPDANWEQIPPAPAYGLILWETILKFED
jgi:tRNA pseudouridine38-40 synthase